MKIVLIGYMGSGKTEVGKQLSATLKLPFYDLDTFIEKREGMPISKIFSKKGEIYFRKLETQYLREFLEKKESIVFSLGGGTPCFGDNIVLLNSNPDVLSVFLNANFQTLSERLFSEKEKRPLIAHINSQESLENFIKKHLFERSYYYSQAKYTVKTEGMTFQEVVEKIVLQLF